MNPNDLLNQIQSQLDKTLSGAGSITDEVNQLVRVSVTKALSGLDTVSYTHLTLPTTSKV